MESCNRLKDMLNCYDYELLIFVTLSTWKDTFEHLTELILLGIPEITELVANTVASTFLVRFGCLATAPLDNNLWNVQFTCLDKKKGKSFSLHFFFACLCISFGRIESSGAQTCDIYPYLAILPLRIEKSGTHMMRRPLTLLPS